LLRKEEDGVVQRCVLIELFWSRHTLSLSRPDFDYAT
jgi:hypothetical protein